MRVSIKSQFLLFFIILTGSYLRFSGIKHPLWLDELATSWVCSGDFFDLLKRWDVTALSPLYYSIVYLSKLFFGFTETGLRIPNILFGILTIPLVYQFTLRLTQNTHAALFAATIIALDFDLIYFSLELRPYSILTYFVLLHIYLLYLFLECEDKRVAFTGFILTSPVLLWLHYTVFPVFIIDLIIVGFSYFHKGSLKKLIKVLSVFLGVLLLSFIPLFEHTLWLQRNSNVLNSFIPDLNFFQILTLFPQSVLYILVPFLLGLAVDSLSNVNSKIRIIIASQPVSYVLLAIMTPYVFFLFLKEMIGIDLFIKRYLLWTIPFIAIMAVMIVIVWKRKMARLLSAILLLMVSFWPHIGIIASTIRWDRNYQTCLLTNIFRYNANVGGWEKAVNTINTADFDPTRVYLFTNLVEREYLTDSIPDHEHLGDYLLSVVNSLYPLKQNLIDSCLIVSSSTEFDKIENNTIILGPKEYVEAAVREIDRPVKYLSDSSDYIKAALIP